MYSVSDVLHGLRDPTAVIREANRLCHTQGRRREYNPRGIDVFGADWDNLILLDACRYDYFEACHDLPGRLEARTSRGGATYEFVRANFTDRTLHDVVYVTTNSWYVRLRDELGSELHDVIDLHLDPEGTYHDDEFKIVMPDTLAEQARAAADRYPNKRLLIHYIQPHHPFVGPTGREHFGHPSSALREVFDAAEDATLETLRRAYRENVEIALDSVAELLPDLPGKTVVSADHGEMLGERHDFLPMRDIGHHEGIYNEALTRVPWHVIEGNGRKRIVPEPPQSKPDIDAGRVERRLADLGYIVGDTED